MINGDLDEDSVSEIIFILQWYVGLTKKNVYNAQNPKTIEDNVNMLLFPIF